MLNDGYLIKINEELCFASGSLNKLRDDYKAMFVKDGKATPVTFKDITGLLRKYIIPLMEYFNVNKLTVKK
jgi:selenocysteine-specific elongation factor